MSEPRDEDQLVLALAPLRRLAHVVEQPADAVGGGLQNHLAAVHIRHRLHDAGHVRRRVGPVRHLGAVEILQGVAAADRLRARGADPVAGIDPVEKHFLGIARAEMGFALGRIAAVESFHHFEDHFGGIPQMGQDEGAHAAAPDHVAVKPRLHIGRDTGLAGFQDKRARTRPVRRR